MDESTTPANSTRSDALAVLGWIAATVLCAAILIAALSWVADRVPTGAGPAADPTMADPGVAGGGPASGAPTSSAQGTPVSFSLPTLDGETLGPEKYRGQVVVLEFWATWCGPCRMQAQMLEKLMETPRLEGYQILAVNLGENPDTVRRFVEKTPFPYPVVLDEKEVLGRRFGINGLPTVMILDPEGRLAFHRVGVTDPGTLQAQIESARL